MCGIAGFSLPPLSSVDRTLAAQVLLAGIAERGADAVGYAYRSPRTAAATVVKRRVPASRLLDQVEVPPGATDLLVHVRDYTKEHPSIAANNHPVRHGPIVGIHNGKIVNDDELLAGHACARSEPRMTVDSEAIFSVAAHSLSEARSLEALRGSMAAAWLDERRPELVYLARGVGRPLWLGRHDAGLFFASTEQALGILEQYSGLRLRKRELAEGTLLSLRHGTIVDHRRFRMEPTVEDDPLPPVRAPQERASCLSRLASLAATA